MTRRSVLVGSTGLAIGAAVGTGTAGAATTATVPQPTWTTTPARADAIQRMRAAGGLLLAEYPEELVAYSREDGSRQWAYEPGARQYTTTPRGGTAYVQRFGTVTAIGSDGDRQWQYEHGDATVSVVIGGERVLVGDDESLVGLTLDGDEAWRVESGATRPVAADSGVVAAREPVADGPDRFAGIDAGAEVWSYDPPTPVEAVDHEGGSLFAALDERVVSIPIADGTVEWELETGGPAAESVIRSGDLAVVGVGGRVIGVDHASGEVQWANPVASELRVVAGTGSPAVALSAEPAVYVVDGDGMVVYEERLDDVDGLVFPAPAAGAGETVYVAASGVVTAFDSNGSERWSRSLGGGAANSLAVDAGGLFALDGDTLYRLPAANDEPTGIDSGDEPTATNSGSGPTATDPGDNLQGTDPGDEPTATAPGDESGSGIGDAPVILALAAGVVGGGSALAYYLGVHNRE